MDNFRSSADKF